METATPPRSPSPRPVLAEVSSRVAFWQAGDSPGGGYASTEGRWSSAATVFQKICTLSPRRRGGSGSGSPTFYGLAGFPEAFSLVGYYCQPNCRPLHGHVLVATAGEHPPGASPQQPSPLCRPRCFSPIAPSSQPADPLPIPLSHPPERPLLVTLENQHHGSGAIEE